MHNQPREPQPYEDCQAKSINMGELHKEWTEAGVKASRATTHRRVKEFGYSCRQRRLTWDKEKKNWTVAQWSKVLFSDESKFCISFGNQVNVIRVWGKGGEAHSPSCLKSSVKFPQSVMIWGAMCCRPRLQGPRRQITVTCKTGIMSEERESRVCSFTAPLWI